MTEVNTDRVRLLVDALRSGQYEQARGALEVVQNGVVRHCCLGVACRVAMANGLEVLTQSGEYGPEEENHTTFNGVGGYLPRSVREWYGFPASATAHSAAGDPILTRLTSDGETHTVTASALNDSFNADFDQIADAFEGTYLNG